MYGFEFFACLLMEFSDLHFVGWVECAFELIIAFYQTDISSCISNLNENIAFGFGKYVLIKFHTIKITSSEFDLGKARKQIHFHSIKTVLKRWLNGKKLGFEGLKFSGIGSSETLGYGFNGSGGFEFVYDVVENFSFSAFVCRIYSFKLGK